MGEGKGISAIVHEQGQAPLTTPLCLSPLQVWPSAKALLANRKLGKSCVGVLEMKQNNKEQVGRGVKLQNRQGKD
jgi:hypothetical protein